MNKKDFFLGEDKIIEFEVYSPRNNDTIVIKNATYSLALGEQITENGNCIVNGNIISIKLSPKQKGYYILEITYQIGNETLKERVGINAD